MQLHKLLTIPFAIFLTLPLFIASCGDSTLSTKDGKGTLEVLLHDAPANYQEVNVFIESVEVNNANTDTGWVEINSPEQSYNLLELTNGATAVLGSTELEPGTYNQIRLILSREGHSVVIDSTQYDMFVPSGAQTGIKLNVNAEIEPDLTYTLLLDFDAARSVVKRGSGQASPKYLLKPVVRATSQAASGNIAGIVEPVDSHSFVYAIAGSDTLSSTKADTTDGSYKLIGLDEGTYTVSIDPSNDIYQSQDTTGVQVTIGETNDIGTITLSQN